MKLDIHTLSKTELEDCLPEIAQLRIEVFRDWPYLYAGDAAYEEQYLQPYLKSPNACVVGAFDGARLVGAATSTPLADHADDFADAFKGSGHDPGKLFYCAESVLLPQYRGQGAGHRFFDLREAAARAQGFGEVCFAAVIRPDDHPKKPADARSLQSFWRGRGYSPLGGVVAEFAWKDVGAEAETHKPLQFWHRYL